MSNQNNLNKITRATHAAGLGDKLAGLIALANSLRGAVKDLCLSPPGLSIGTLSTSAVKIANTVTYLSGGVFKSKSPAEVAFTPVVHNIPANASAVQEAVYVVTLDGSGTPTLTMGMIATGAGLAPIPTPPADQTVIGYVRIAVAAGATSFTAGTTALNNAALTVTYTDAAFLPVADAVTTLD
jgi:hypothetical protein